MSYTAPSPLRGLRASIHARSSPSVSTSESCTTPTKAGSTASSVFSTPSTPQAPDTPPETPFSSPPPSPYPSPKPVSDVAKSKAYYRLVRLDKGEIQRRNMAGKCTYCSDMGHSRRTCAAGRIMRKVPKRMLDSRLRSGVCPLCGDPEADGHSKLTCPDKQKLQAALDAKRDMGHGQRNAVVHTSSSKSSQLSTKLREGTSDSILYGSPRRMNKTMRRRMLQATTPTKAKSNVARISVVTGTHSALAQTVEDDLIDFGDTRNASPATMSTTGSLRSLSTSTTSATVGSLHIPPPKFATFTSFSSFRERHTPFGRKHTQVQQHKQNPKQSLLDMATTEVVWGGVSLPVGKTGVGLGQDFDMDMDVDDGVEYASQTQDLIEV